MKIIAQEGDKETYLSRFPQEGRSWAMNHLLEAVRAGCRNPFSVVGYAIERAKEKVQWNKHAWIFLSLAEEDPMALLAGARWALWWESLSHVEKETYRRPKREEAIRAWMEGQPPTERQLSYLRALGYSGPEPKNRWEASKLIEEYKGGGR